MVWAVGGMPSVSSVGEHRVLVEDVVELAMEARHLVLAEAETREMGDVRDILARQAGHGRRIPVPHVRPYPTLTIRIGSSYSHAAMTR